MQVIGNLLRYYMCAKNCRNRTRFDKDIAKLKRVFDSHGSFVRIILLFVWLLTRGRGLYYTATKRTEPV